MCYLSYSICYSGWRFAVKVILKAYSVYSSILEQFYTNDVSYTVYNISVQFVHAFAQAIVIWEGFTSLCHTSF